MLVTKIDIVIRNRKTRVVNSEYLLGGGGLDPSYLRGRRRRGEKQSKEFIGVITEFLPWGNSEICVNNV